MSVTASSVIDQIVLRLAELSTVTPIHWTRNEILTWVNYAVIEICLISGELQDVQSVSLNTSANVYSLSGDAIAPLTIMVGNKYLQRESVRDLDSEVRWEASDQTTGMSPTMFCSLGLTQILVYPRSANTATVMVLSTPTVLTDGSNTVELRDEYIPAIQDFCVARAMFKEGGAEFSQGIDAYNRFLDIAQQLTGRNILRRYPAWSAYTAKTAQITPRSGHTGVDN